MLEMYRKNRIEIDFTRRIDAYMNKWGTLIESNIKEPIIPYIKKELSLFLETILIIDDSIPVVSYLGIDIYPQKKSYPEGWMSINEILTFISTQFDNYYYSLDMNYEIEKEYINILTKKKTYLIKTKTGSVMFDEFKQDEIIEHKLNDILDTCIDYVVQPEKRKQIIRKFKIDNILN